MVMRRGRQTGGARPTRRTGGGTAGRNTGGIALPPELEAIINANRGQGGSYRPGPVSQTPGYQIPNRPAPVRSYPLPLTPVAPAPAPRNDNRGIVTPGEQIDRRDPVTGVRGPGNTAGPDPTLPPGSSVAPTPPGVPNDQLNPGAPPPIVGAPPPGTQNPGGPAVPEPAPIDYDALIAADPEYQMLLARLDAAMANAESDFGAESATLTSQTQRRLQQLREMSEGGLRSSSEDFSGRGLGFSGQRLESAADIRRQEASQTNRFNEDLTSGIAGLIRQKDKIRQDVDFGKKEGYAAAGRRVRGQAGNLGGGNNGNGVGNGPPTGDLTSPGLTAPPPSIIAPSPAAVERRLAPSPSNPMPNSPYDPNRRRRSRGLGV